MTAPFPIDPSIIQQYLQITNGNKNIDTPISEFSPVPSQTDYQNGYIDRFFARQTNQQNGQILEISSDDYNSIKSHPFYTSVSLTWKISGPDTDTLDAFGNILYLSISHANQKSISIAEKTLSNLRFKLTNVYQFWQGN